MSVAEQQLPQPELRPLRWWHLDGVVALEQAIFGPTAWSLEQFYAELAAERRWWRVLTYPEDHPTGDHAAGVCGYIDVAVTGRDADLMTIAVAADLRGRGLGGALLRAGLAAAVTRGADTMFLEVRSDNPARELYSHLGFAAIDTRRNYYGPGSDAVVMRRRLGKEDIR